MRGLHAGGGNVEGNSLEADHRKSDRREISHLVVALREFQELRNGSHRPRPAEFENGPFQDRFVARSQLLEMTVFEAAAVLLARQAREGERSQACSENQAGR